MKHILYISILFFSLTISAQRKHLIIDGEIKQSGIPKKFTKSDGTFYWGGYQNLSDEQHYADGWREEFRPEINHDLQKWGERYYDIGNDVVTWAIIDKTVEELAQEKEMLIESIEQDFDIAAIKKLLIILTKDILNSGEVDSEELEALVTIHSQYRENTDYVIDEVFVYENELYRVIQAHLSQADWLPGATASLYTKYTPPGVIAEWLQPTGAHDAYALGIKVIHNSKTWESTVDDNVWEPGVYGWVEI